MLKFLSITLLFFFLFVNSTIAFADSLPTMINNLEDLRESFSNNPTKRQELQKLQKQQQETIVSMQKDIDELKKLKNESQKREELVNNLTTKQQELDKIQKNISNELQQQIDNLQKGMEIIIKILKIIKEEI